MYKILVVEDEPSIRDLIAINLERAGYEAEPAASAEEALALFEESPSSYCLALLDIMLPGMSGLELCSILREKSARLGIIILTARVQEQDKITGLKEGADDYVTKPFSINELLARVEAVMRRAGADDPTAPNSVTQGIFTLDKKARRILKNGEPLDLTQVEYQIIEFFFSHPETALDRDTILKAVWGDSYYGDVKIVDVNIRRLRIKVEDEPSSPRYIQTVWGYGYRWCTD